ncbi:hypothetical protein HEK616_00280 [Streptomyces nigrescens]|uniref:Uncharacterized protein n=1 Tax=Streptomyces nigrescens TaxID=1920 RepID=A0ABM7ZJS0_STRNI|nr:hypothetical protein HEK616_00280 [Streptomyces nigrescens]
MRPAGGCAFRVHMHTAGASAPLGGGGRHPLCVRYSYGRTDKGPTAERARMQRGLEARRFSGRFLTGLPIAGFPVFRLSGLLVRLTGRAYWFEWRAWLTWSASCR